MTNDDNDVTKDEQIKDLRDRLWAARETLMRADDQIAELKLQLKHTGDLRGPEWSTRTVCSDGRLWAMPLPDSREAWVRCFAGQALSGAMANGGDSGAGDVRRLVVYATVLWDDLEKIFGPERRNRAKQPGADHGDQ